VSNIGNTVSQDAYQIGAWGKLGPGNLAFVVSYDKNSYKAQYSDRYRQRYAFGNEAGTEAVSPSDDYDTLYTEKSESKRELTDLYLAYGLPIGDRSSLGFSWRHGDTKVIPAYNQSDPYSEDYVEYAETVPATVPPTSVVRYTSHVDYLDSDSYTRKQDATADTLAVEYKMRPSDTFSFKVRGTYATGSRDNTELRQPEGYFYGEGEGYGNFNANENGYYYNGNGGTTHADGDLQYQNVSSGTETYFTDTSFDATQWSVGGKINWERGTGGLQIDLAYASGDFDFKNSRPFQETYTDTVIESEMLGDPEALTESYHHTRVNPYYETVGSQELTGETWLVGAKYLWKWDNVDFLAGVRYSNSTFDARFSGVTVDDSTHTDVYRFNEGDPITVGTLTFLSHDVRTGTYATTGSVDRKNLELPLAVIVHVTDKLALRFGVQHTFYTAEYNETDNSSRNSYVSDFSIDGVSEPQYVDTVSYSINDYSDRYEYDTSETSYRLGLEYKVNDHVVADFLINEGYGGNSSRKQVDLGYVVAGVSIRF
jgi:hypothetical protein